MRDTHQGNPELLDTYERDGLYFGVVRVTVSGETTTFEFGVDHAGYNALRGILQTRPFSNLPGIKHKYFLMGRYTRKKLDEEPVTFGIRIEQDADAKAFDFDGPTTLASNLLWFQSLQDLRDAAALKRLR